MTETKMKLVDWLDDLCVRFIINLPQEELASPERICFQIEEAQWFYEDFIRPLDPKLPSLNLRKFCEIIFQHCPLLHQFSDLSAASYQEFLAYKTRVPVRGAIMLNEDMTEVVLVKGWKKGAKWSFPRGKINKDEPDLDCAIREVYEETGFDIKAAGLVPAAEDVKSLDQTMREQHMRLFVFRGIPMDTYFEPRTRKEISKISWYKLADLPTLKNARQLQQGNGEDTLKGSHFYMVAPFIRALRVWIKQQRRLDKIQGKHVPRKHVILEDDEAEDTPAVEETADEGILETTDVEDSGHMDRLLFNLRNSKMGAADPVNLPEVSTATPPAVDLSAQLKGMLGVGGFALGSQQPVQAPQEKEANPLLAILRGTQPQQPSQFQQSNYGRPPHTPADQIDFNPPQARTPHHNHPRPPQLNNMGPPPTFPISPQQQRYQGQPGPHFQQPQHPHGPRAFPNQPLPPHNGFRNHGPPPHQQFQGHPLQQGPPIQHVPQHMPPMHHQQQQQQAPKPWERTAEFAPQFPQYNQAPVIPAASKLPAPKLSTHASNLLNMFKSPIPQTAVPVQTQKPPPTAAAHFTANLPLPAQAPAVPQITRHPTKSPALQHPQATKPRNTQQDALLNLFRAPSTPAQPANLSLQDLEVPSSEPVELSAQPSPNISRDKLKPAQPQSKLSMRHLPALNTAPAGAHSPGVLTSATVSGPLNAPDFESVRRNARQKPAELGNGHPSPLSQHPPQNFPLRGSPRHIMQQPVVPPAQGRSPPRVPLHTVKNRTTTMEAPQPFHPTTILRRGNKEIDNMMASPQQMMHSPPKQVLLPAQAAQVVFDRRDAAPREQKQTLLNLFGGAAGFNANPTSAPTSNSASVQPLVSALPGAVSDNGSPVSPLPSNAALHAATAKFSRDDSLPISLLASAGGTGYPSRIGSFASDAGIVLPGTQKAKGKPKSKSTAKSGSTPGTPVDTGFLLGFLESVANSGGTAQSKGKGKGA